MGDAPGYAAAPSGVSLHYTTETQQYIIHIMNPKTTQMFINLINLPLNKYLTFLAPCNMTTNNIRLENTGDALMINLSLRSKHYTGL